MRNRALRHIFFQSCDVFGTEYDETQIERQHKYFETDIQCHSYIGKEKENNNHFRSHLNWEYERQRKTVLDSHLEMVARQEGKAIASLETAEQRHEYRELDDKFQEKVLF